MNNTYLNMYPFLVKGRLWIINVSWVLLSFELNSVLMFERKLAASANKRVHGNKDSCLGVLRDRFLQLDQGKWDIKEFQ